MSKKPYKLPKHIAQMVEKNNLVMAIKTLSEELNISMDEAKNHIDDYETQLKTEQAIKTQKISSKQGISTSADETPSRETTQNNKIADVKSSKFDDINASLGEHLDDIGYTKPLVPYWVKRILVILLVVALLSFVFWRLVG